MTQAISSQAPSAVRRLAHFFRFRLLTLFLAVTLIASWLAWTFHREPISQRNANQLRKLNEIPYDDIYKLVYSPNRTRVAFVGWKTPVDVREAITLWPVRTIGADRKLVEFAFSPDQRQVAYGESGTRAEIVSLDGSRRHVLDAESPFPHLAFSRDGKLLATGGYGIEAKVWNVETGQLMQRLDCGPEPGALTTVFSPDGRTIAVGNRNAETNLFDVASGRRLLSLPMRSSHELAFHPSGRILAVAYVDGSVGLWEAATGKLIAHQQPVAEEIYTLDWSPDGNLLASAGLRGEICLWDQQLQLRQTLAAPEWTISVKFSPDGTRLVTAGGIRARGGARSVTVWGIKPSLWRIFKR